MPLTTAGAVFLAQACVNDSPTFFNNANAYIGVGDSTTAFAIGQTDLQAAVNKLRKGMMATYPTRASGVVVWKSEFGSAEANFAWNEWGVFNAAAAATMLCRKVESLGTKSVGSTWQIEAQGTFSA